MRLVTWNACNGKFEAKARYLNHLHADVAVIQDIARPKESYPPNVVWFGEDPNQGVAVVTRAPYVPKLMTQHDNLPKYVVPVEIEGPQPFLLFAVWTLGEKPYPYVQAVSKAIESYESVCDGRDVVMMGDFNSNAIALGRNLRCR